MFLNLKSLVITVIVISTVFVVTVHFKCGFSLLFERNNGYDLRNLHFCVTISITKAKKGFDFSWNVIMLEFCMIIYFLIENS